MKLMRLIVLAAFLGGCGPPSHTAVYSDGFRAKLRSDLRPYFDKPETIDYAVVKAQVLEPKCMKCHSLDSEQKDINAITYSANLTNYASLFNMFTPVVTKGNPEASKLYHSMAITQTMPIGDPLDGLQLKLVRLWILNCAIEDKAALGEETLVHDPDNPEKVRECP